MRMDTFDIIGQKHISEYLRHVVETDRVPHALLFSGEEGSGTLPAAIHLASALICSEHSDADKCRAMCGKLQHPDLHFAFPTAANQKVKSHPVSDSFLEEWREFVQRNPYAELFDWYRYIGVENKQGKIGVDEAKNIVQKLRYRPHDGKYQVMIIWMAEMMHASAANKLLKIIEEPPKRTVFILITRDEEQIIDTIRSRCQKVDFGPVGTEDIAQALVARRQMDPEQARIWAERAQGSYGRALRMLYRKDDIEKFDRLFVHLVRSAFRAKGNPAIVNELIEWSQSIAGEGREVQKEFLLFAVEVFRQALLANYGLEHLVHYRSLTGGFELLKFAPFVHNGNITGIINELEEALLQIRRNGNAKLIFLDLSMKLIRWLHTPEVK